ncbi:CvpA family protein [Candidatus Uhrbacteria bacterium]|nr:CvpA family protein [Candidatus Uhrbacteria bacterium]
MSFIDLLLYILLGGFALYGFWFGLIHTLGGLVGVVLSSVFASRLYEPLAAKLFPLVDGDPNAVRAITFIAVFIIITRLVGFVFWILERVFKIIAVIPFLKSINRLAGAVFGFLEGVFLLGGIIFVLARFPVVTSWQPSLHKSPVAHSLARTYSVLVPLLPRELREFEVEKYFRSTK